MSETRAAGVPGKGLGPRVDSLDLLRGVAILGIFLMNTQSMLLPQSAYTIPASYGDFTGWNVAAYLFTHLFADMKFITIFSFMFGAGIMLQGERVASRGMSPAAIHYRRMAVLLVIALIHAYLIWYGDILTTYACCGIILFPLRRMYPALLMALGIGFVAMVLLINFAQNSRQSFESFNGNATAHPMDDAEEGDQADADMNGANDASVDSGEPAVDYSQLFPLKQLNNFGTYLETKYTDVSEMEAYTGPWGREIRYRTLVSVQDQTTFFWTWTFWRCGGAILVGMALQRWRFFHGEWGKPAYWTIALFCISGGALITGLGIAYNHYMIHWNSNLYWKYGQEFNYVGSLLQALGYMAAGVLVAQRVATPQSRLLKAAVTPIRAVGKMALSNYLFQSLVGTTLSYEHVISPHMWLGLGWFSPHVRLGLGWFGQVERARLLPIVLCVWAFQLVASPLWLKRFRQGPVEWVWHKLVYLGRDYPLRPAEGVAALPVSGLEAS